MGHWNTEVIPRDIFGGAKTALNVDGISVYELDRNTGKIVQHRIERTLVNDMPVRPITEYNLGWSSNLEGGKQRQPVSIFSKSETAVKYSNNEAVANTVLEFKNVGARTPTSTSLFASEEEMTTSSNGSSSNSGRVDGIDWDAYERKNATRKKFGLKPITPEEFVDIANQVQAMQEQQSAAASSASAAAEVAAKMRQEKKSRGKPGFMDKIFGGVLKDTCESNFDCQRPEVCCDLGFKKMCCSSGMRIANDARFQPRLIPVPIDSGNIDNKYPPPRGGGSSMGYPPNGY